MFESVCLFCRTMLMLALVLVAGVVHTSLAHSDTYMHPPQALGHLQRIGEMAEHLTSSDMERIAAVSKALSPLTVLQEITRNSANISDVCFNQSLYVLESLINGGPENAWALQMVDAWGKPGAGIKKLNIVWLGDFDECQSVTSYYNSSGHPHNQFLVMPKSFVGQYCGLGTPVGPITVGLGIPFGINVGSCFPSGCSQDEISHVVTSVLKEAGLKLAEDVTVGCQVRHLPYSNAAIATIAVFSVMAALCLTGTFYDIMFIMSAPNVDKEEAPDSGTLPSHSDNDANLTSPALAENNVDTQVLITSHEPSLEPTPSALGKILMCFSLYTNGYKLLSTKQAPDSLTCLHGIRFLSLAWVILGHTLVFSMNASQNPLTLFSWMKDWTFQIIINGTVSVDSFFVLSALLTSYLMLKQLEKKKTTPLKFFISVPVMYLHRYIRLTPAYGAMLLFYACLILYTYNGPLKPVNTTIGDAFCTSHWYTNILYVNNIIKPLEQCAPWTWYLSDDFQFFLVTPFVAYLMYRLPSAGLVLAIAMVITSIGTAIGASVKYDLGVSTYAGRNSSFLDPTEIMNDATDYYYAPWSRYQSFGVGVIFGFILWKCRGKLPIPRFANLALWAASGGIMLAVIYGPYDMIAGKRVGTIAEVAMYNGIARTAWSLALGYVMLACCLGRGGWVNELLSWRGFVPLSRMTYCAYLVHPVVMTIITSSHKNKVLWSKMTVVYMFGGYLMCSYAVAFVFSLLFEVPFMLIDKKYLTGRLR